MVLWHHWLTFVDFSYTYNYHIFQNHISILIFKGNNFFSACFPCAYCNTQKGNETISYTVRSNYILGQLVDTKWRGTPANCFWVFCGILLYNLRIKCFSMEEHVWSVSLFALSVIGRIKEQMVLILGLGVRLGNLISVFLCDSSVIPWFFFCCVSRFWQLSVQGLWSRLFSA